MDELTQKICEFLLTNPNSSAREIGKEIGFSKNVVNSCLYANEGSHFLREGITPPLWKNSGDSSEPETAEADLAAFDLDDSNEDVEVENEYQEEDWARLSAEDQQIYHQLNACVARGEFLSRQDRRLMNQLLNRIRQSGGSKERSLKKQEQKAKNRAEFAAKINEKVNQMWSPDQQRMHAKEALTKQFESYLMKLAYGHSNLSNEMQFEDETESDRENRLAESLEVIQTVRSYIETRLTDLENLSETDLVSAGARLAWLKLTSEQSNLSDPKSASDIFPKLCNLEDVKIYKSRFQKIVQRVDKS